MGIENWYIDRKVKGAYKAMNNDGKTSVLGVILAAIIALNVNYSAVFHLDPTECGKLLGAVVTAMLGYYINKPRIVKLDVTKIDSNKLDVLKIDVKK